MRNEPVGFECKKDSESKEVRAMMMLSQMRGPLAAPFREKGWKNDAGLRPGLGAPRLGKQIGKSSGLRHLSRAVETLGAKVAERLHDENSDMPARPEQHEQRQQDDNISFWTQQWYAVGVEAEMPKDR